jgi:hypothetical protein
MGAGLGHHSSELEPVGSLAPNLTILRTGPHPVLRMVK